MQLGTPSENRTHIYPLGGDYSIHLTIGAYVRESKLFSLILTNKFYYNYSVLSNLYFTFSHFVFTKGYLRVLFKITFYTFAFKLF